MTRKRTDRVVSLFSGAGGFSLGFAQAGLQVTCGAEHNADACATYESNLGSQCRRVDLSDAAPTLFADVASEGAPFAVIGGPPCQGFSTAGSRRTSDPRNKLIFNYLRIVSALAPRWFVFENVEGLLTSAGGLAVCALVREFLDLGYSIRVNKVNMAAYGVPQTRKRVVIIGNNLGLDFQFPDESHSYDSGKSRKRSTLPAAPCVDDALLGLGTPSANRSALAPYTSERALGNYDALMRAGNASGEVSGHFCQATQAMVAKFALLGPGQTMKDLPEDQWHPSYRRRAFRRVVDGTPSERRGGAPSGIKRLVGNRQSLTITGAATREFVHPREDRTISLRESARIQSFPDTYQFIGGVSSVAQQIGNAVPPLAAKTIAEHLVRLDGAFGAHRKHHTRTRQPRLLGFILTESGGMSDALRMTDGRLSAMLDGHFSQGEMDFEDRSKHEVEP